MSAPIGPGDYVECIREDPGYLVVGQIYVVEGSCEHCITYNDRDPGIEIVGVTPPHNKTTWFCCFDPARFRPIYRPSDTILKSVLEPVDGLVDA